MGHARGRSAILHLAAFALVAPLATSSASPPAQEAGLVVTPAAGVPGTDVRFEGTLCCDNDAYDMEVSWTDNAGTRVTGIGSARKGLDNRVTGGMTVPLDAAVGIGTVTACGPGSPSCIAGTLDVLPEVLPPTLVLEPTEVAPGGSVRVSGEGWCCGGGTGSVTDVDGDRVWGTAVADRVGRLSGEVIVPDDVPVGPRDLAVCIPMRGTDDLCQTGTITIVGPDPPPSTPNPSESTGSPGTDTTPSTTGTASDDPDDTDDAATSATSSSPEQPIPAAPIGGRRLDEWLARWIILVAAVAAAGLLARNLLRWRGAPVTTPKVVARYDPGTQTIGGPNGRLPSIRAVWNPHDGTTTLRDRSPT